MGQKKCKQCAVLQVYRVKYQTQLCLTTGVGQV